LTPMHDWTLVSLFVDWEQSTARLEFKWNGATKLVTASGLTDLRLPRQSPWGPSNSVNRCVGPTKLSDSEYELVVEMQSGDKIRLAAEAFDLPPA
jgi:hypothetical protein